MQLYQRTPNVTESTVGSKKILYHPVHKKAVVLNVTGSWVWSKLEQPYSLQRLVQLLQAEYPALQEGQLRQDLEAYLQELHDQQVVSLVKSLEE